MAEFVRSFSPELEIRSAAKGGDGRTVEGIAVPYNVRQRIDARLVESFAPGSSSHQFTAPNRVKFSRGHLSQGGQLLGRAIEMRDDASGLYVAMRAARTAAGDETLALVEDGALDELSVSFRERQNRRLDDGTIERVRVDLLEVALVLEGAYGRGAVVTGVREATGEEDAAEDVDEQRRELLTRLARARHLAGVT